MLYKLNQPDIIQEVIDGEVLIINSRTGLYYSIEGAGARCWNALLGGNSIDDIVEAFVLVDETERSCIRTNVEAFVSSLLDEELLASRESDDVDHVPSCVVPIECPIPSLVLDFKKYTDMQELLLVDPIHDVDSEVGWPIKNSDL